MRLNIDYSKKQELILLYQNSEYKKALKLLEGGAERMYAVVEGYE